MSLYVGVRMRGPANEFHNGGWMVSVKWIEDYAACVIISHDRACSGSLFSLGKIVG